MDLARWRNASSPDGFARNWLYYEGCSIAQQDQPQPKSWAYDEVNEPMKSLFERLRTRRLASVFVLLATLSVVIVAGSFAAHGVRGQEKQNDSSDATPLKVVNSTVAPNEFVKIAQKVGPAVVNINTETLPKSAMGKGPRNLHRRVVPTPQQPGDDDDQDQDHPGRAFPVLVRQKSG